MSTDQPCVSGGAPMTRRALLGAGAVALAACRARPAERYGWKYVVVPPGTHPGILFSKQELPALRRRARGKTMAAAAYRKVRELAHSPYDAELSIKEAVGRPGEALARHLEAMALVCQVEEDEALGARAIELFRRTATGIDPVAFYREVDADFFATEHWPKAFAVAWDWLFGLMEPAVRAEILESLEAWNAALFDHTESWWWREASYNCGAIPTGAQGMLLAAIQAETQHPKFEHWFSECFRKIRDNYYRFTWRESGICTEGPGYAHYHKNPTQFAEAVRRTGGPDIIPQSGAVRAMHYLRHQWMPQGGCGPIGDNTGYGRRVFQSIYLHGIRELGDQAGLWTFVNFTDFERINPILIFLFWPDGLEPVSPGTLGLRTSAYFETDRHRAGTVFARSRWDDEEAAWFAFVTRYGEANHTHYDMNTFLFSAFGEAFATHANIFPYGHEHHGVDFEHNIVIIDGGGMPAADRRNSAGDDGSLWGFLTGLALGEFADYVRGDAHRSYKDRSVPASTPARRADRSILFAKQGPNPYVVIADDIQKDGNEHDYWWQWYTEALEITGTGIPGDPFRIEGKKARCLVALLEPEKPDFAFQGTKGGTRRHPIELGLLRVKRRGVRVRYLAAGVAFRKGAQEPRIREGPQISGPAGAASLVVEGDGFRDIVVWQPDEDRAGRGKPLTCGLLETDALMAMVRTDLGGRITGYVMGEGTRLAFGGRTLAEGPEAFSVSAGPQGVFVSGKRRALDAQPPLPARGTVWLPSASAAVWADEERTGLTVGGDGTVRIEPSGRP